MIRRVPVRYVGSQVASTVFNIPDGGSYTFGRNPAHRIVKVVAEDVDRLFKRFPGQFEIVDATPGRINRTTRPVTPAATVKSRTPVAYIGSRRIVKTTYVMNDSTRYVFSSNGPHRVNMIDDAHVVELLNRFVDQFEIVESPADAEDAYSFVPKQRSKVPGKAVIKETFVRYIGQRVGNSTYTIPGGSSYTFGNNAYKRVQRVREDEVGLLLGRYPNQFQVVSAADSGRTLNPAELQPSDVLTASQISALADAGAHTAGRVIGLGPKRIATILGLSEGDARVLHQKLVERANS